MTSTISTILFFSAILFASAFNSKFNRFGSQIAASIVASSSSSSCASNSSSEVVTYFESDPTSGQLKIYVNDQNRSVFRLILATDDDKNPLILGTYVGKCIAASSSCSSTPIFMCYGGTNSNNKNLLMSPNGDGQFFFTFINVAQLNMKFGYFFGLLRNLILVVAHHGLGADNLKLTLPDTARTVVGVQVYDFGDDQFIYAVSSLNSNSSIVVYKRPLSNLAQPWVSI